MKAKYHLISGSYIFNFIQDAKINKQRSEQVIGVKVIRARRSMR
jgi:hypothetical protein